MICYSLYLNVFLPYKYVLWETKSVEICFMGNPQMYKRAGSMRNDGTHMTYIIQAIHTASGGHRNNSKGQ